MPAESVIHDNQQTSQAFAAARAICRRHARTFYFASAFLPAQKRQASYAVYAFCRMMDDAIDQNDSSIESHNQSPGTAIPGLEPGACCSSSPLDARLALFRARLDEIYESRLDLPLPEFRTESQHALHAFSLTVHRYEIPKQYFLDLAEGCRMDLVVSRYATWNSLEKYCYHVAGVVGLIMSCIFGLQHSDAKHHAVTMGNAMQLTNILRDVKEDWDRGRVYLPLEDLARFRYSERDIEQGVVNENFRELMRFEIARARKLFHDGSDGLCWLAGDGSRLTASAMAVVYAGILDAIEQQRFDVFSRRAHLSLGQKLARLPASWRLARREPDQPLPNVFRAVLSSAGN
ncbi:MAG TPA: phytoene/squalene synthase family protein [Tepidisphaeraceae bacterium]